MLFTARVNDHQTGKDTGRSDQPVLELSGLTAGYGDLAAVRNISLKVCPGELVALFGPNGAGKTTTLLAACGVLTRKGGDVSWRGAAAPATLHRFSRAGLMLVPEGRSVITSLNVRDNLRLGRGSVGAAMEYFPELEKLLDRKAGLLSGGEQQMLALGRALAMRPAALLVDELSLGLAPLVVERMLHVLRVAADERGLAVLLVEQQARRALSVLDRWYLLSNGEIVGAGDAAGGTDMLEAVYLASVGEVVAVENVHDGPQPGRS